jgi:hypothetical protein
VSFGLDPAGTYFSARAGFDVQGTLRFNFGPVSLNLLTAHAILADTQAHTHTHTHTHAHTHAHVANGKGN